jgi:hypothetical protein
MKNLILVLIVLFSISSCRVRRLDEKISGSPEEKVGTSSNLYCAALEKEKNPAILFKLLSGGLKPVTLDMEDIMKLTLVKEVTKYRTERKACSGINDLVYEGCFITGSYQEDAYAASYSSWTMCTDVSHFSIPNNNCQVAGDYEYCEERKDTQPVITSLADIRDSIYVDLLGGFPSLMLKIFGEGGIEVENNKNAIKFLSNFNLLFAKDVSCGTVLEIMSPCPDTKLYLQQLVLKEGMDVVLKTFENILYEVLKETDMTKEEIDMIAGIADLVKPIIGDVLHVCIKKDISFIDALFLKAKKFEGSLNEMFTEEEEESCTVVVPAEKLGTLTNRINKLQTTTEYLEKVNVDYVYTPEEGEIVEKTEETQEILNIRN